ncbi:hypothetical protein FISHEDRAFT_68623 [Fistulina hepatica ATCC 64428]|uniref:Uncharacterized protein n=1 Tax=Fistulina hepatica ATCC 64428 TaxID=1128425 RepID=A0A0D7ASA8_9AGAR|nr:hypothetical protein FISHEDRAFT_68623 [Fistulina hepatica ATCC 64428]
MSEGPQYNRVGLRVERALPKKEESANRTCELADSSFFGSARSTSYPLLAVKQYRWEQHLSICIGTFRLDTFKHIREPLAEDLCATAETSTHRGGRAHNTFPCNDSLASSNSEGGLGYARSDTDGASVDEDKQYADDEVARGHGPSSSIASSAYSMSSSAKDSSELQYVLAGVSYQHNELTSNQLYFDHHPPSSTWAVVTSESPVDPLPLLGRSFTTPETSSVEYHIHPTGQTSASHAIPRSLSTPVAGTYHRVTPTQAVFPVHEGAPAGSDDTEYGHELDLSGNVVRNDSVSTTTTSGEPLCRLKHDDSPPSLSSISPTISQWLNMTLSRLPLSVQLRALVLVALFVHAREHRQRASVEHLSPLHSLSR